MTITQFQKIVWNYYKEHGRHTLLWRAPAHIKNPYRILVSEVMLQQTQVSRVAVKYPEFIAQFPNFTALARASTRDVLHAWQGLGYNRRALNLKRLAEIVIKEYHGALPQNPEILQTLPGIGKATAGSLAVFAFNLPAPFIETNIRRAFIHSFFAHKTRVRDEEIEKLAVKAMDMKNPREWYYALMDYGAMLREVGSKNPNRKSVGYRIQPKFEGSRRALRGKVLRLLLSKGGCTEYSICEELKESSVRVREVLRALQKEKFIIRRNGVVKLV